MLQDALRRRDSSRRKYRHTIYSVRFYLGQPGRPIDLTLTLNSDFNTPKGTLGTSLFPGFVGPDGHRSSAATAYLTPDVQARQNLTIATDCCVTKIFLSAGASNVEGVEVARMPASPRSSPPLERWRINVKKEAILSAGTIGTPQILMLSGIGPREDLARVGVKQLKELDAVGKNLIDVSCT